MSDRWVWGPNHMSDKYEVWRRCTQKTSATCGSACIKAWYKVHGTKTLYEVWAYLWPSWSDFLTLPVNYCTVTILINSAVMCNGPSWMAESNACNGVISGLLKSSKYSKKKKICNKNPLYFNYQGILFTGNLCHRQSARLWVSTRFVTFCDNFLTLPVPVHHMWQLMAHTFIRATWHVNQTYLGNLSQTTLMPLSFGPVLHALSPQWVGLLYWYMQ